MPIFTSQFTPYALATVSGVVIPTSAGSPTIIGAWTVVMDQIGGMSPSGLTMPYQAVARGDCWIALGGVGGAGTHWIRLTVWFNGTSLVAAQMGTYNIDAFDKYIAVPIRALRLSPGNTITIGVEQNTGGNRTITAGNLSFSAEGVFP